MLPFFIMARLLLLLFTLLFSFNTYSSDSIPVGQVYRCYDAHTGTDSFIASSVSACMSSRDYYFFQEQICSEDIFVTSSVYLNCAARSGSNFSGNVRVAIAINGGQGCPTSHPIEDNGNCFPEPTIEPHSCPEAGTFYKRMYANSSSIAGFSTCLSMNCVVTLQKEEFHLCINNPDGTESCPYDVFYTGQTCAFNPDDEGMKPPEHEWPEDPVEPPAPDTSDDIDLPDYDEGDPVYDPDGDGLPDDPVEPPNPDPQPDPDNPDLSTGENAIVGELSEANQRLENIDSTLVDLTNTIKLDNDTALAYQAQFLGQMTEINRELDEGGLGSGGGGGGTGTGEGEGTCEEDCVPVNFPGAPEVVDPFAEILDETDINDIITRTEETKTQLESKMNNFKGLFSVPNYGGGGTITPIEFDLQHRDTTIPVKFGIFDIIAPDIASIITLIAAVICFLIVTTRR